MQTIPTPQEQSAHDESERMSEALERAARALGAHGGPGSTEHERRTFGNDLRTAALRYASAYYAEARTLGLIPEHEASRG